MNKPFSPVRKTQIIFNGPRVKRSLCAVAAFSTIASLCGCASIDSGGFQNYQHSAIAHQQAIESGAATQTSVKELSSALPPGSATPAVQPGEHFASSGKLIKLSLADALVIGLKNNPTLLVQRYNPALSEEQIVAQRGAFDPTVTAGVQASKNRVPTSGGYVTASGGYIPGSQHFGTTDSGNANVGLNEKLPTGTSISATMNSGLNDGENGGGQSTTVNGSITVTQALLQGGNLQANLAGIESAKIGKKISDYQLRGEALTITDDVVQAYWAYALAQQNVHILKTALNVAQQQEDQTKELIRVGRTSPSEFAPAAAQTAVTREQLVSAVGAMKIARLNLLSLIAPADRPFWQDQLDLTTLPYIPGGPSAPLKEHTELALKMSPVLNQTRLQIEQGDLSVIQTRNGLLPVLNMFITFGKTGYAESFGPASENLNGSAYQLVGGLSFNYPIFNRTPTANYQSAVLSRDQEEAALANTVRTVELSVRTAYIQAETDKQQITATAATTEAQAETLRATQGEFKVGESTAIQVSLAQSNLLAARLAQAQANVAYLDALSTLYLQEGSLLERCHIRAPGAVAVKPIGPSWLRRWPDGVFH